MRKFQLSQLTGWRHLGRKLHEGLHWYCMTGHRPLPTRYYPEPYLRCLRTWFYEVFAGLLNPQFTWQQDRYAQSVRVIHESNASKRGYQLRNGRPHMNVISETR